MASFFKTSAHPVSDIRAFLAGTENKPSLKYASEKDKKHQIYIPYKLVTSVTEEGAVEVKEINGYEAPIHEWTTSDGKYHATACMSEHAGTCPMCDRVKDAWEIFNYRKAISEEAHKGLEDAEEKNKADRKTFLKEMKMMKPVPYVYMLIAQFKLSDSGVAILDEKTGLPKYDLKVMKLSKSRLEKIYKAITTPGLKVPGAEVVLDYPNLDDPRTLTSNCVTAPLFPTAENSIIGKYPAVVEKIQADADAFNWDTLENTFQEFKMPSVEDITALMNAHFKAFDAWKEELKTNPNAKYLEFVGPRPTSTPAIETAPTSDDAFAKTGAVNISQI